MMKNIRIFIMVYLLSISLVVGQNKPLIAVKHFTANKETRYGTSVTNKVIEMMKGHNQFEFTDEGSIKKGFDKQKEHAEMHGDNPYVQNESSRSTLKKARYILSGNIDELNVTKRKEDGNITGFFAFVSISIKVSEIGGKQKILETKKFVTKKRLGMSEEGAIYYALESLNAQLKRYFKKDVLNYNN